MAETVYPFTSMEATIEGNLGGAPKRISRDGKASCVVSRVAVKSRNQAGEEVTLWMDVKTFGQLADNIYETFSDGKGRLVATGPIEFDEYNDQVKLVMNARQAGPSLKWNTAELGDSAESSGEEKGRSRRSRDDDDDDDSRSSRSSRRRSSDDDDDDEGDRKSRSSRRRSSDDDDDDDKPRSRRSRDDDDDDDDDNKSRSSRRSRRRSGDDD